MFSIPTQSGVYLSPTRKVEQMKLQRLPIVITFAVLSSLLIACSSKTSVNAPANSNANRPAATTTSAANSNSAPASSSDSNAPITVTGKWEMVGREGEWKGTVDMVGMDGFLWSVDADGSLYKTDPATGNFTQVGEKGSFTKLKHLEAMDHF